MSKEHLVTARTLIENGWVKSDLYREVNGKPCYCLDGAISQAHGFDARNESSDYNVYTVLAENPTVYEDVKAVHTAIMTNTGFEEYWGRNTSHDKNQDVVDDLWRYNDKIAKSKEEVIAVLDKAIADYPVDTSSLYDSVVMGKVGTL